MHGGRLEHVNALLDDVEFHQPTKGVRGVPDLFGVVSVHIANVSDLVGDVR